MHGEQVRLAVVMSMNKFVLRTYGLIVFELLGHFVLKWSFILENALACGCDIVARRHHLTLELFLNLRIVLLILHLRILSLLKALKSLTIAVRFINRALVMNFAVGYFFICLNRSILACLAR